MLEEVYDDENPPPPPPSRNRSFSVARDNNFELEQVNQDAEVLNRCSIKLIRLIILSTTMFVAMVLCFILIFTSKDNQGIQASAFNIIVAVISHWAGILQSRYSRKAKIKMLKNNEK
jgi:general stress protein CsbA